MNINPKIFKAYDVRGIYPDEFNEEAAYHIAKATVKFLKAKSTVLAYDMRSSSKPIYEAVLKALKEEGIKIFDVGLASTPMHTFIMNLENADSGIMITASHNPPQYNGMKLEMKFGASIGEGSGMEEIKETASSLKKEKGRESKAEVVRKDYLYEYVKFLAGKFSDVDFSGFSPAVDASNGMAGFILPVLFEKLKIKYYPLYFELDGTFPNHEANPSKPENLEDIKRFAREKKASFGVIFDGDADRLAFIDGHGQAVSIDLISAAMIRFFLKEKPGSKIIYSVSSSRIVKETIENNGGQPFLCRIGHSFVRRLTREKQAYFGCEKSGHCFFEDFFYADSAIFTMLSVLRALSLEKKTLEEFVKPFNKYFSSGEINLEVADKEVVIRDLESNFKNASLSRLDGLTVEYPDWWFNIRQSNTEPVIRLNVEAENREILEQNKNKILRLIKRED